MVKLMLYSLLSGYNAFISTNEIVLMKAEIVLRDRRKKEKERGEGKKSPSQHISGCLKLRYCIVKRGGNGM